MPPTQVSSWTCSVVLCCILLCCVVLCCVVLCCVVLCCVVLCCVVLCCVVLRCVVPKALLPEGNGRDVYPQVQVNGSPGVEAPAPAPALAGVACGGRPYASTHRWSERGIALCTTRGRADNQAAGGGGTGRPGCRWYGDFSRAFLPGGQRDGGPTHLVGTACGGWWSPMASG